MRFGFAFSCGLAVSLFFFALAGNTAQSEFFFSIFMGLLVGVVAWFKCPEKLRS